MLIKEVQELLDKALKEREYLFLIDLSVSETNHIKVIIDGDEGVSVEDCIFISRAVEHNLDREDIDFSLEVTSAGATEPLLNKRQYKKSIGRTMRVKTNDNPKIEGELIEVAEDTVTLQWKTREPKPVGKGKTTVVKEAQVAFKDIVEAKVMIKF